MIYIHKFRDWFTTEFVGEQEEELLNTSTNPDKTLSGFILEEYKADLVDIIETPKKTSEVKADGGKSNIDNKKE